MALLFKSRAPSWDSPILSKRVGSTKGQENSLKCLARAGLGGLGKWCYLIEKLKDQIC